MLGDAALASKFADAMLANGIYVIGFRIRSAAGQARIRTQLPPRIRSRFGNGAECVQGSERELKL